MKNPLSGKSYVVSLVVAAAVFSWVYKGVTPENTIESVEKAAEFMPKTEVLKRAFHEDTLTLYGTVNPIDDFSIVSDVSGRVAYAAIEDGQWVRDNEVLLELDSGVLETEISALESKIDSENKRLKGIKKLMSNGYKSEQSLTDQNVLIEQLNSQLRALIDRLEKHTIRSKTNGYVRQFETKYGDRIQPGQSLGIVSDTSVLEIELFVPEKYIDQITRETPISVRVEGYQESMAIISSIDVVANAKTHRFKVTALIENTQQMKAGLSASADLMLAPKQGIRVSPFVLETRDDQLVVDIWDQNQVKTVPVTVLKTFENNEVLIDSSSFNDSVNLVVRGNAYVGGKQ